MGQNLASAKRKLSSMLLRPSQNVVFASVQSGLSGTENIVGVGIDEGIKRKSIGKQVIKVFVKRKLAEKKISESFLVPKKIVGIQTEVEEVGEIFAQSFTQCYNCVDGGSSIGHLNITAGTYGCMVSKLRRGTFMLSNNHVMANSNNASKGNFIVQPGPIDGGKHNRKFHPGACRSRDRCVGVLADFQPILFNGSPNTIDAAIASVPIRRGRPVIPMIKEIGEIKGTQKAAINMRVMKSGRTTEFTTGKITSINMDVNVNYGPSGVALFTNQIVIRANRGTFSQGGDSGSLIVNENQKGVGLLFAGNNILTFANHIGPVLSRFKAKISNKGRIPLNPLPAWLLRNRSVGGQGPIRYRDTRRRLVGDLQRILIHCGYDLGKGGVDCIFGKMTLAAVKKFQSKNQDDLRRRLKVDGLVGPLTSTALNKSIYCKC